MLYIAVFRTERHGQVIAPVWYYGGPGLNLDTMTDYHHCGFPQSLQTNAEILSQFRLQQIPSTPFPIHYSLIVLPFDAILGLVSATESFFK
jgi:hypothetical protein